MREATREPFGWRYESEFQPTLPMRGATLRVQYPKRTMELFQPTLPMRGATTEAVVVDTVDYEFQPTLPMRGATDNRRFQAQA